MLAQKIFNIVEDYQCDYEQRKFNLSPEHVQTWASQFGDDADFVLSELLHFLPEIYVSKEKARNLLRKRLIYFQNYHGYKSMYELVASTHFFDVQALEKSQGEILCLVDEILQTEYMIQYTKLEEENKKHFIYFDDILATGGTILRDLKKWLDEEENGILNKDAVLNKKKTLALSLFCYHSLGFGNFEWQLMKHSDDKLQKLLIVAKDYLIENNLKTKWMAEKQRLNCAYPIVDQPREVMDYLGTLDADYDKIPAFRPIYLPRKEMFFSSPKNRTKLENLFLQKGIELLAKVKTENPDRRKRPLGDTIRSHKTFGTGTLFFTWRNISNTCPLVFWWDVPGHDWVPLFCVKNRGN